MQALELTVFQLPYHLGAIQFVPVFITYFALTRGWGRLFVLALVFSFIGSFTIGYSAAIFMAVQVWTALVVKIVVSEFALEGRQSFTFLVAGSQAFGKTLTWILLRTKGQALSPGLFLISLVTCSILAGAVGWFLYPRCLGWDTFFQHPIDEARELNPDILR